jgi:hypothetical protein
MFWNCYCRKPMNKALLPDGRIFSHVKKKGVRIGIISKLGRFKRRLFIVLWNILATVVSANFVELMSCNLMAVSIVNSVQNSFLPILFCSNLLFLPRSYRMPFSDIHPVIVFVIASLGDNRLLSLSFCYPNRHC